MFFESAAASATALPSVDLDDFYDAGFGEVGAGFRLGSACRLCRCSELRSCTCPAVEPRILGGSFARAVRNAEALLEPPASRESALEPNYAAVRSSKPAAFFGTAARSQGVPAAAADGSTTADAPPPAALNPSIEAVRPRVPAVTIAPPPSISPSRRLRPEPTAPGPGAYGHDGQQMDGLTRPRSRAVTIRPPSASKRAKVEAPRLGGPRVPLPPAAPADAIRRPVRSVAIAPPPARKAAAAAGAATAALPTGGPPQPPPDLSVVRRAAPAYSFGCAPRRGLGLSRASSSGDSGSDEEEGEEAEGSAGSEEAESEAQSPPPLPRFTQVERRAAGASFGSAPRFAPAAGESRRGSLGDEGSELRRASSVSAASSSASAGAWGGAARKPGRAAVFGTEKRKVAPRAEELALEQAALAAEAALESPSGLTDISDAPTLRGHGEPPGPQLSTRPRAPAALILPEPTLDERAARARAARERAEARRAPGQYGIAAERAQALLEKRSAAPCLGKPRPPPGGQPPQPQPAGSVEAARARARELARAARERERERLPGPASYDWDDSGTRPARRAVSWARPTSPPPAARAAAAAADAQAQAAAAAAAAAAVDPSELDRAVRARVLGGVLPRAEPREQRAPDGGAGEGAAESALHPSFLLVEPSACRGGYLPPRRAPTAARQRVPTAAEARLRLRYGGPLGLAIARLLAPAAPADALRLRPGRGVLRWHGPAPLAGPPHPPLRKLGRHELGIDSLMPNYAYTRPRAPAATFGLARARPPGAGEGSAGGAAAAQPGPGEYEHPTVWPGGLGASSALGALLFGRALGVPFGRLRAPRMPPTGAQRLAAAGALAAQAAAAPAGSAGGEARAAAARAAAARAELEAGARLLLHVREAVARVRQSIPGFRMVAPALSLRAAEVGRRRAEALGMAAFLRPLPPADPTPARAPRGVPLFARMRPRWPLAPRAPLTADLDYSPLHSAVEPAARAHAFGGAADAARLPAGAEADALAAALSAAAEGLYAQLLPSLELARPRAGRGASRFGAAPPRFVELSEGDDEAAAALPGPGHYAAAEAHRALLPRAPAAAFGTEGALGDGRALGATDAASAAEAALRAPLEPRFGLVLPSAPAYSVPRAYEPERAAAAGGEGAGLGEGDVLQLAPAHRPGAAVHGAVQMDRQSARAPLPGERGGEGADVAYAPSDALVTPRVPAPVDMARELGRATDEPRAAELPLLPLDVRHGAVERAPPATSFPSAPTDRLPVDGGGSAQLASGGALLQLAPSAAPVQRTLRSAPTFDRQLARAEGEGEADARPMASADADAPLRPRAPAPVDMARMLAQASAPPGAGDPLAAVRGQLSPRLAAVRPNAPAADFGSGSGRQTDERAGVGEGDVLQLAPAQRPGAAVHGAVQMDRQSARVPLPGERGGEGADVAYAPSDALVTPRVPAPVDMARELGRAADEQPGAQPALEPWYEPSHRLVERSVPGADYARGLEGGRAERRRRREAAARSAAVAERAAGGPAPMPPPADEPPPPPLPRALEQTQPQAGGAQATAVESRRTSRRAAASRSADAA